MPRYTTKYIQSFAEIASGLVWRNADGRWARKCPICQTPIVYCKSGNLAEVIKAHRNKRKCKPCSVKDRWGRHLEITDPKIIRNGNDYSMEFNHPNGGYTTMIRFTKIELACPHCGDKKRYTIPKEWLKGYQCHCSKCSKRFAAA